MAEAFRENRVSRLKLWGPFSALGLKVAACVFALDQLSKWWVLTIVNIDERPPVQITPFMDLVMAWNKGVSYSLFTTDAQVLLIAVSLVISGFIWIWIAKARRALGALAFGMVLGGALGNALDRLLHGAVVDFVHLHWGTWSWYIFNIADIAIVAGVALLLYEGLFVASEA